MIQSNEKLYYLSFRVLNVLIRPASLFAFAFLSGDMFSSGLALAYTMGAWLMAPMSLGSYRWTLPIEKRNGWDIKRCKESILTYQLIYYVSLLIFCPATFVAIYLLSGSAANSVVAALVVAYDFTNHEQSRRLLYQGKLQAWARFLAIRNLALACVCLFSAQVAMHIFEAPTLSAQFSAVSIGVSILLLASVLGFHKATVVSGNSWPKLRYLPLALSRIKKYWQLSFCGVLSNSHTQIDRILISIILPQYTWVVMVLGYCAQLPAMVYEMLHLARLKASILQMRRGEIEARRRISLKEVLIFIGTGVPCAAFGCIFLYYKSVPSIVFLIAIYMTFSFLLTMTMKKSELVVWARRDRWAPVRIDTLSGLATLVSGTLIGVSGQFVLVKLPAVLGLAIKSVLSDKYLKDKVR